jgi:uncharacterized protein (UPF0548 family)/uncharacterized membrane protein
MASVAERLAALGDRAVNYDPDAPHPPAGGWRYDDYCQPLPSEPPGPPVEDGSFRIAQRLLRDYQVTDPRIVRAHYDPDAPLAGRDMLLELRFLVFRTYAGCRIGDVTDESRDVDGRPVHVWGWPYRTLEGHVEEGQMAWEVWKWLDTGEVEFRIHSYSRFVGASNPFTAVGVKLFGQRQRRRYLSGACLRMAGLTQAALRGEHPAGARAGRPDRTQDATGHAGRGRPAAAGGDGVMTPERRIAAAALLGAVCGMRTFAGPAALAARGRVDGTAARVMLTAAAVGEAIGDKTPLVPRRTGAPALAGRVASGALCGRALAGAPGLAAGGAGALAGALGAYRARTALTRLTGLPGAAVGVGEDAVAAAAAALATRADDADGEPPSRGRAMLHGAVRGAVAGVTATAAMTAAQSGLRRITGTSPSRAPEQATRTILRRLFGTDVPRPRRDTLNAAAHWLYGTAWGLGLGLVCAARGRRPAIAPAGTSLGLAAWSAALVQLPAMGLAPPPWRQPPGELLSDAGLHLVHGLTAAAVLRALP